MKYEKNVVSARKNPNGSVNFVDIKMRVRDIISKLRCNMKMRWTCVK